MNNKFVFLTVVCLLYIVFSGCTPRKSVNGVNFWEKNNVVSLENNVVKMDYNLATGYYKVFDKAAHLLCIDSAYAQINKQKSIDDAVRTWRIENEEAGVSLVIQNAHSSNCNLLLKFSLQKNIPYILLSAGIDNQSNDTLFVNKIMPLADGKIFEGKDLSENLRILEGNGGGERTLMRERPSVLSRNNILIHFGNEKEYYSLVMGGITYNEFNKFAG
ncbi:MAG: hypothetical protein LBN11_04535, partial [Tannerella sp.]|nr:hypothetical protein [Tannerella sp.]